MRTIVVASGKGGVGKTTIVANLGIALSEFGFKTVVIDADIIMANLEIILGIKNPPTTIMDVLKDKVPIEKAIYDAFGTKVIPAGITLDGFNEGNLDILKAKLSDLFGFDFVIIDAPAGRDAALVMSAGEETLIVTTPEVISISDALKMKILSEKLGAKSIGVVINKRGKKRFEIKNKDIENTLELPVLGSIPRSEIVERSLIEEVPFIVSEPNSKPSIEIKKIASNIANIPYKPPRGLFLSKFGALFGR